MTSWSRAAPEKAGDRELRYFRKDGEWTVMQFFSKWNAWVPLHGNTMSPSENGYEFGPRVPSASEIERAAEALEIAEAWAPSELSVPESARKGMEFSKERIRAALEGLRKGQ